MSTALEIFEDLQISSNDQRLYRYLTLPNQLKVLLISDKDTEKCSACCDVHIGSLCDPDDIHGLAHFLEHMLFMGTEKYPEENEYSVYITKHGGFSNAYTSQEDTVYYFDIQNNSFENALNLFATFFWCPLFHESSMQRELQAVDNENTKNLQSDPWRTYQLLKSFAKSDHPLNKFSTGNLETLKTIPEQLGIDLRERLMQFHRNYYSANLMSLVIYGNQPLDTLQQWVEEKFSPIENKNLTVPRFPTAPFGPEELGVMIEVVPVKDLKDLDIYIPLPAVQEHYRYCNLILFLPLDSHRPQCQTNRAPESSRGTRRRWIHLVSSQATGLGKYFGINAPHQLH
jgi:insulysin